MVGALHRAIQTLIQVDEATALRIAVGVIRRCSPADIRLNSTGKAQHADCPAEQVTKLCTPACRSE